MGTVPADRDLLPRLHLVTDDDVLAEPDFPRLARLVLEAGNAAAGPAVALHVRGRRTSGRRLHEITSSLVVPAERTGATLVVNDRVDVALATGVPAVHLGRRSLGVCEARHVLGVGARVGVSTHTAGEAGEAVEQGADWIFVGTIYETPSHAAHRGCGPRGLASAVASAVGTPALAIGGITPARVAEVVAAGAYGVAVVRGVWRAPDPLRATREYLGELAAGRGADGAGSLGSP